jgi:hypothetical protein
VESAELIAILQEVRDRVRARHPQTSAPGSVPLADLLPLVHARDAALGKVASIGMVNPRPRLAHPRAGSFQSPRDGLLRCGHRGAQRK